MPQHWPILVQSIVTPESFIAFWDRLYSGYDEEFYKQNIGQPLTEGRITQWFQWKNGTALAPAKAKSIRQYFSPAERISADADDAAVMEFLNRPGGAIWRTFWLHLHPTALWPYYGINPDDKHEIFLLGGYGLGRGFPKLAMAQEAVETQIARESA